MATAQGSEVSVAGGKFRLKVDYSYTTTAIKFKPFIVVTNNFSEKETANVKWVNTSGKWVDHKKSGIKGTGSYYIPDKKYKTNGDYQITIKATIAGKTSTVTLTSNLKPSKPKVSLKYINDAHINVIISGNGKKAVPSNTVTIQRLDLVTSNSWETIKTYSPQTTGSYSYTYADQSVQRGERYKYRVQTSNQAGGSGYVTKDWIYTRPPEVSDVAHVRNSNKKCTVSWQREIEYVDRKLITSYKIERRDSGGNWIQVGTKKADATKPLIESYADETTTTNNYYSYRIKTVNSRGTSPIAYDAEGTEATYNTPAAPSSVKAAFNTSGDVVLTLVNPEITADTLQIQRSLDSGSTWSDLDEVEEETPILTYTDETGPTGTGIQYRCRNARSEMESNKYSSWTVSNVVQVLAKPSAPTLTMPVENTPVVLDYGTVRLSWVHNANDGTPQTAAQIQYYVDGTYIATITLGAVAYYDLTLNPQYFSANSVVTWKVRTKGSYNEYSDYSEEGTFTVLTLPQIHFLLPLNDDVITNLPLDIASDYSDESGLLQQLTLEIIDSDDKVVYTEDLDTGSGESGAYNYSIYGFLFDNDTSYGLRLTALSSSGLSSVDEIGVAIEYESVRLQNSFFVDPEIDAETGRVNLFVSIDESPVVVNPDPDAEEPVYVDSPVDHASLYRVVNGKRKLLKDNVEEGDELTDMYAPLNVTYQYELVEVATTGEVALVNMDVTIPSEYWYIYWDENIARVKWNPQGSVALSRPEKQQIRYSGREYPVTYDSKAIEETYNYNGIIASDEIEQLGLLRRLIQDGGQGIWKSCDGQVYSADFTVDYSADYTKNSTTWDIGVAVTRIDSEDL